MPNIPAKQRAQGGQEFAVSDFIAVQASDEKGFESMFIGTHILNPVRVPGFGAQALGGYCWIIVRTDVPICSSGNERKRLQRRRKRMSICSLRALVTFHRPVTN